VKRLFCLLIAVSTVATACGSDDSPPLASTGAESPTVSLTAAPVAPLVGRWEQMHVCVSLVDAIDKAGLGEVAAYEVGGEFFPNVDVKKLAKKPEVCAGAKPFRHAHYFDGYGTFGSLDQHDNQVDDGTFTIVDHTTMRIGQSTFRYRVSNGDTLTLRPVISKAARRETLAHPGKFTEAIWMVSVAYEGTTWHRVDCEGWC
jgi:hypothetical protein